MLRPYSIPTVPTHSFLGGLEVGVCAGGVIGDVAHRRHVLRQHPLDALPERDVGHPAALTAAAHPQHDDGVLDIDELDASAVACHHRVHLLVEHLGDLLVQRVIVDGAGPGGGAAFAATGGAPDAAAARIAAPTAFPTACHGAGLSLTTVTMLPETITSVTPPAGIAKIASASGDPFASSADAKRRTPVACSGWLTTNLQR